MPESSDTNLGDYREGLKAKPEAVRGLVRTAEEEKIRVDGDAADDLDRAARAFAAYLGMLDDFDRERGAALRGAGGASQDVGRDQDDE